MSTSWPIRILTSDASGLRKLLLLSIWVRGKDGRAELSIPELMRDMSASDRTVRDTIQQAELQAEIEVERRKGTRWILRLVAEIPAVTKAVTENPSVTEALTPDIPSSVMEIPAVTHVHTDAVARVVVEQSSTPLLSIQGKGKTTRARQWVKACQGMEEVTGATFSEEQITTIDEMYDDDSFLFTVATSLSDWFLRKRRVKGVANRSHFYRTLIVALRKQAVEERNGTSQRNRSAARDDPGDIPDGGVEIDPFEAAGF